MATKLKAQIVKDINEKIITNGDIKAVDTNAILKDILDCKELNNPDNGGNLMPFHFWNDGNQLKDQNGNILWYSFKGIEGLFVNFTFRLLIHKPTENDYHFRPNEIDSIFNLFLQLIDPEIHNQMDFLVKIKNTKPEILKRIGKNFIVGAMSLSMNDQEISIIIETQEVGFNLSSGEEIFSSITFHCPAFKLG